MPPQVLYFAPGSGLGHVTRAVAICLELRELGVAAGIVTNSPFAKALAELSRIPITQIASAEWEQAAPRLLAERVPPLAIVDTFPNGMRGEWTVRPQTPLVHVARRLRLEEYGAAAGAWAGFALTIAIERLAIEHEALLQPPLVQLPGLIRLRPLRMETAVPAELDRMLDAGAALVVHGGPMEEVEQLVAAAGGAMPVAVITPWKLTATPSFDYFPAANLIHRARHIFTGAGYNSIADTMHHRFRHTAIPFPRRFDDQAGRLAELGPVSIDSTREAAQAIADLLGS
ncbi:MAG: hypothetical protein ABI972_08930 [Acidobacteriota bacterium]